MREVYDCFMFYNEVEILQLRIRELYDSVDYFVIVEAKNKHQDGEERETVFDKIDKRKLSRYKDKIKYFQVDLEKTNPFDRENEHRNKTYTCVRGLNPDDNDIILVSDLDEMPNKEKFDHAFRILDTGEPVVYFNQMYFVYFYNCYSGKNVTGTAATTFNTLRQIQSQNGFGPQTLRNNKDFRVHVDNGGWHFSYMGGANNIRLKSESIFDGIPASEEFFQEQIEEAIRIKKSPYSNQDLVFLDPAIKDKQIESVDLRAGQYYVNSNFTTLLPSEITKNNKRYEKYFHRESV